MNVSIRPVEQADLDDLLSLRVAPSQKEFVAPNAVTLAEAAYEDAARVYTIRSGHARVGLIALIDMTELDPTEVEPYDEPQSGFLWRLMVGHQHQGNGYGTAAIRWAIDWARMRGRPRMSLEVHENNGPAIALYESLGFRATGVLYGDEEQMAMTL